MIRDDLLTIRDRTGDFDAVVFAQRNERKWMAGSREQLRTHKDEGESAPETAGADGRVVLTSILRLPQPF